MRDFSIGEKINMNYYNAIMPGMTEQQALYILRDSYKSYPQEVRIKAAAIVTSMQERIQNYINKIL